MSHPTDDLDEYQRQYLETALWSSVGEDDRPLDADHGIDDIAPGALASMLADCSAFRDQNAAYFERYDEGAMGHDFWLTRNRHGAGFWDGDYEKDDGAALTKAAHAFGGVDLYVGDDGLIYVQ